MNTRPKCPRCLVGMTWNPARELWEHHCGFTATPEELD